MTILRPLLQIFPGGSCLTSRWHAGVRPFRDLAHGLGARGIAVLRYEKRTKRYPPQSLEGFTLKHETIDDALAAIATLRSNPSIAPAGITVLGHSLGALALPRMATSETRIASFIVLAGGGRPLEMAALEQLRYLKGLGKVDNEAVSDFEQRVNRLQQVYRGGIVPAAQLPFGIPAAYWLDLAAHPISRGLAAVRRPILVLHGDRDYQVTATDFSLWKQALKHNSRARFKSWPTLGHAFTVVSSPSVPEDYALERHVENEVIDEIAAFILKQ